MKSVITHFFRFIILSGLMSGGALWGDLFVDSPISGNVGELVQFEYVSSDILLPVGELGKVVLIVQDIVLSESGSSSGFLSAVFDHPGTIDYVIKSYSAEGNEIDSVERSILIYGIGVIQLDENNYYPLGSRLFLTAEAIFSDKSVHEVSFEVDGSGSGRYQAIAGSADTTYPYSFLYDPSHVGVLYVRAVAHHPDGSLSYSTPVTIQVGVSERIDTTYVSIIDPASGETVEAGISRKVNVDVSTNGGPVKGVQLYVDGVLIGKSGDMDIDFPFQFDWTPMRPGRYSLVAIVKDNRGMYLSSDEVLVTASDDRPHVELLLPDEGALFLQGTSIPLVAIATGQGGSRERVRGVEFLVNGNAVPHREPQENGRSGYIDLDPPFTTIWTPDYPGSYLISARVIDDVSAATHQSQSVMVSVVPAEDPVVTVLAPYGGDEFYSGETISIEAAARDSVGQIVGIDFFVNDLIVGSGEAIDGRYKMNYTFPASGFFRIKALATNDKNRMVYSEVVNIEVKASQGVRPDVSIDSPTSSDSYQTGDSVRIEASASDSDGHISCVRFYVNGELFGREDTQSPFVSDVYEFPSAGLYRLEVQAKDQDGNLSQRSDVTVEVGEAKRIRPTISISSPLDGQTYEVGNSIVVEADAQDVDGHIQKVSFLMNGELIGEVDSEYPYQTEVFEIRNPGIYSIECFAEDDQGNLSTTSRISVIAVPHSSSSSIVYDPVQNHRDFLIQIYHDLLFRNPTHSEMNRYLEKLDFNILSKSQVVEEVFRCAEFQNLRYAHNSFHALFSEWPSPLDFAASLQEMEPEMTVLADSHVDDVGNHFNDATPLILPFDGFSGSIDDFGDVDMFVFQVYRESLYSFTTTGSSDLAGTLYDFHGNFLAYDDDSGDFFNLLIQSNLNPGTYYFAVSGWGGTLGQYDLMIKENNLSVSSQHASLADFKLEDFIGFLRASNTYVNRFGSTSDHASNEANRRKYFEQLYRHRFNQDPSLQQIQQGASRLEHASSIESFVASFIINDRVGLNDYIYQLPNVQARDDAAYLIRSFFKVQPVQKLIEPLLGLSFVDQVDALLAHPSYLDRFVFPVSEKSIISVKSQSAENSASSDQAFVREDDIVAVVDEVQKKAESPFQDLEAVQGWKYLSWFGWFSDHEYPWLFHEHLGWVQSHYLSHRELQIWHSRFDWAYAAEKTYPYLYRYEDKRWIFIEQGTGPGDFLIQEE